jgi:HD-GYP domain-containing protein (c-di-GMP phosphodiesterase class II)
MAEDAEALDLLEELPGPADGSAENLLASPEFASWGSTRLVDELPALFLDSSLRILHANEPFVTLFDPPALEDLYFTRFFGPSFDEARSAALFRAVRSPDTGWSWVGRVERTGRSQLLIVSKVSIQPLGMPRADAQPAAPARPGAPAPCPRAYRAVCVDITVEYRGLMRGTFTSLLEAARRRDNDTGHHVERVNRYARVLAERMVGGSDWPEVDRQFVESIGEVAALHDVGKIGTPDDILNKAGPLESWEWGVMKQHTINGAYILHTYPNPMAHQIALSHHERWDGHGYPYGMDGAMIPLAARVVAIVDVYDALRMRRTYKDAYPHERALETIEGERGTHFDAALVDHFLAAADVVRGIFGELADAS